MLRAIDRAIGVISTLVVGAVILSVRAVVIHTFYRIEEDEDRDDQKYEGDYFYRVRFGNQSLVAHQASCHCGCIRFSVKAPAKLQAIDCNDTLSNKKGRYPHLIVPIEGLHISSDLDTLAVYGTDNNNSKHLFCKSCGVHVFHVNALRPDVIDVNLYCLDEDNIVDVTIMFLPKHYQMPFASKTKISVTQSPIDEAPLIEQTDKAAHVNHNDTSLAVAKENTILENSLLGWAELGNKTSHQEKLSGRSHTVYSHRKNALRSTNHCNPKDSDQCNLSLMKMQLRRYLQHHLPQENSSVPTTQSA